MMKIEEMATSLLNEIASRIDDDIDTIMNAGEQEDWNRITALQTTAVAIMNEIEDRAQAAAWAQ